MTQFGVPKTLISNNGFQFDSKAFKRYCGDLRIKSRYSTQPYPQSNGQAKDINKTIVSRLKKKLENAKERCAKELPNMLWAY